MASRILALRRDDRCARCDTPLVPGTRAFWDAERRTTTCVPCLAGAAEPAEVDRGRPGASAAREHDRRRRNRERDDEPAAAPHHERAFLIGSQGEQAVARTLAARTKGSPVEYLHDRRMPGGRGNIDHLAVAPTGVYVIDAKDWTGKVEVTPTRPGPRKLLINRSDQTRLVDGLDRQVTAVRAALATARPVPPVLGVLCFVKVGALPSQGTLTMRGHQLLYRRALATRLTTGGPLSLARIHAIAQLLAVTFPPA